MSLIDLMSMLITLFLMQIVIITAPSLNVAVAKTTLTIMEREQD